MPSIDPLGRRALGLRAAPTASAPDIVLDDLNVTAPANRTAEQLAFKEGAYQWIRKISVVLYGAPSGEGQGTKGDPTPGAGVEMSLFRVDFRLTKQTNQNPNFLDLKVFNLSKETVEKVRQYGRVQLNAGYRGNFGVIFDGRVVMYITGKETPVDSTLNIIAGDQDEPINNSITNLTLTANTPPEKALKTAIEQSGMTVGEINLGEHKGQPTLRSSSYLGSTQRFIRQHTNATDSDFFVDDDKVYVISRSGYRKGAVVELSPSTGLVGFPRVTPSGIEATCLLNPKLRIGGQVHIKSDLLTNVAFEPGADSPLESAGRKSFAPTNGAYSLQTSSISDTGIYKILLMTHHGDTHGNPWYTELVCTAGENTTAPGTALSRSMIGFNAIQGPPVPQK